ncbi:A24 family peptidase [Streptomonospora sediminis]
MPGTIDIALALLLAAAGAPIGAAAGRLVPLFARHDPGHDDDAPPPPPACPHCGAVVPFAAWLPAARVRGFARNGRCPGCAQRVPASGRLALATALLFAAAGAAAGVSGAAANPLWLVALLFFAAVGALLSAVDLRVHRLPNAIVAPSYPIAVPLVMGAAVLQCSAGAPGAPAATGADLLLAALGPLGAMAALAATYWLLWFIHPAGMGWGDVKIAGLVGLYLGFAGPWAVVAGTFAAFVGSAVYGVVLLVLRRATRRTQIPFGPFMIGGALAVLLAG